MPYAEIFNVSCKIVGSVEGVTLFTYAVYSFIKLKFKKVVSLFEITFRALHRLSAYQYTWHPVPASQY